MVALLIPPMPWRIVIALIVSLAAIAGARIPLASWLTVLSVPVSFAILTAVGILVQIGGTGWLPVSIDWSSLPIATGLLLRSTAAISCLAFIGWTTPLMELIPVFGRIGIPNVLIDLALMIYHFLFVTATTLREMRQRAILASGPRRLSAAGCGRSPCSPAVYSSGASTASGVWKTGSNRAATKGGCGCWRPNAALPSLFIGGTCRSASRPAGGWAGLVERGVMNSILEARNVSFAYGPAKWALRDLSFALPTPERVSLLGSNGVGKSTLMLLLNGTLRPQEGELFVLGQPIDYSSADCTSCTARSAWCSRTPTISCSARPSSRTSPSGR